MRYLNYRLQPKYISKLCTLALTIKSKFRSHYFNSVLLTIIRPFFVFLSFRRTTGQAWKLLTRKWSYFDLEQSVSLFCDFPFSLLFYCFLCPSLSPIELLRFQIQSCLLPQFVALLHINWGCSLPPSTLLSVSLQSVYILKPVYISSGACRTVRLHLGFGEICPYGLHHSTPGEEKDENVPR
jgi:hypothetical protein